MDERDWIHGATFGTLREWDWPLTAWFVLVVAVAGWVKQSQVEVIEYLRAENRVLREQLRSQGRRRSLRFTDDQRRGEHTLKEVAARSACSIPKASNVIKALDRNGWTERHEPKRGPGVSWTVTKPGSMLDAWVDQLRKDRPVTLLGHRLMRDPATALVTDIAPLLGDKAPWAVTGWAGLALMAPFLTQTPAIQIYIAADRFDETVDSLLRAARSGRWTPARIWSYGVSMGRLICPAAEKDSVINPARMYADLMALGDAAEDGASPAGDGHWILSEAVLAARWRKTRS